MAAREGKTAVFREIREGVVFAFGYPPVRALLLLLLALAFLGQPYNSLLPVFARSVLGGDSATFGLLVAASGCGAVVAALGMAVRRTVLGLDRVITVCLVLFGIALFFFAQSTSLALSLGLSLVIGFCGLAVMVSVNTIIQALVDDELRGRVMSLLGMVFLGALPLGTLVYGKAASLVGTPATVSVGAMAVLLVGLVSFFRLPAQRQAARIRYEEKGMLEPERAVRG
jgi:MFS family permease